jgi:GT2 family glycosyltransferase
MTASGAGKVLVVVPNYNGRDTIERCLASVRDQTYRDIETVVVDNASQDGSDALVRAKFPGVKLIQNGYNAGWGIACNVGMAAAQSEYIALLNNDAYLDPECVAEMVKAINLDPKYGSCASRILLWQEPEKIEVCGLVIYADGSSVGRGRLKPFDAYPDIEEVFCANDCCCLYRRTMIEEIGEYDPDFFIYCDETDMGWRHQLAGWKCVYTPHAVAYHAHSRAAGSYSAFKAYHVERNRLFICMKYFPLPALAASFFYAAARYLAMVYLASSSGKGALAHYRRQASLWQGLGILIKAHWHALLKAPVMFRRRAGILKKRKISGRAQRELFRRFGLTTLAVAGYE